MGVRQAGSFFYKGSSWWGCYGYGGNDILKRNARRFSQKNLEMLDEVKEIVTQNLLPDHGTIGLEDGI